MTTHAAATERRPIRALPTLVVNQIAAGEVVDRPASVVKELLDNALDAGATRITIELEKGGIELVRVTDDGCGIPASEVELALSPHATSKITDAQDLDAIATMGFRGEALASIASVSRLSLRTRTHDASEAIRVDIAGDERSAPRPDAGPVGTSIGVRNLFFNTPARRKFLRTPQTEQGHCVEIVRTLAISHPRVGFKLTIDGRTTLDLAPTDSPRRRALDVVGNEYESQYIEVHADRFDDDRGIALWGLVATPALARPTTRWQHVYINGRPVRDRTIQHALREAYRGLTEPGKHPSAVLLIEMAPSGVDVNVHPAKSEVRFRDGSVVHTTVLRAVRDALREADLTGAVEQHAQPASNDQPATDASAIADFVNRFKSAPNEQSQRGFEYRAVAEAVQAERERIELDRKRLDDERKALEDERRTRAFSTDHLRVTRTPDAPGQETIDAPRPADRPLRVHNAYLVTQDERGVVIVDQHALHERVMFEKLRERFEAGGLERQRLLMPAVLNAPASQVESLDAMRETFERLGVEVEPIGPGQVGVHAFPTLLLDKGVDPLDFVGELLERAEHEGFAATSEEAIHEILDMMACKAAIKAGDALSDDEIAELMRLRETVERASNCPHGRPTAIRLTIDELEKRFGRA